MTASTEEQDQRRRLEWSLSEGCSSQPCLLEHRALNPSSALAAGSGLHGCVLTLHLPSQCYLWSGSMVSQGLAVCILQQFLRVSWQYPALNLMQWEVILPIAVLLTCLDFIQSLDLPQALHSCILGWPVSTRVQLTDK